MEIVSLSKGLLFGSVRRCGVSRLGWASRQVIGHRPAPRLSVPSLQGRNVDVPPEENLGVLRHREMAPGVERTV